MINSSTTIFGQANGGTQSANEGAIKNYLQAKQSQDGQISNPIAIGSLKNDVASMKSLIDSHEFKKSEIFRTKRSYIPVEVNKRQRLIRAVEEEGLTIKEAAQNLQINYSTAKHIVKLYKKTGDLSASMLQKRKPEMDIKGLETTVRDQYGQAHQNIGTSAVPSYNQQNLQYTGMQLFSQKPKLSNIPQMSLHQQQQIPNLQVNQSFSLEPPNSSDYHQISIQQKFPTNVLDSHKLEPLGMYQDHQKIITPSHFSGNIHQQIHYQQISGGVHCIDTHHQPQKVPYLNHRSFNCNIDCNDLKQQQDLKCQTEQKIGHPNNQPSPLTPVLMKPVAINKNYRTQMVRPHEVKSEFKNQKPVYVDCSLKYIAAPKYNLNLSGAQGRAVTHYVSHNPSVLDYSGPSNTIIMANSNNPQRSFSLHENLQNQQHASSLISSAHPVALQSSSQTSRLDHRNQSIFQKLEQQPKQYQQYYQDERFIGGRSSSQAVETLYTTQKKLYSSSMIHPTSRQINQDSYNNTGIPSQQQQMILGNSIMNQTPMTKNRGQINLFQSRRPSQLIPIQNSIISQDEQMRRDFHYQQTLQLSQYGQPYASVNIGNQKQPASFNPLYMNNQHHVSSVLLNQDSGYQTAPQVIHAQNFKNEL